jgi:hypothetical protein
VIKECGRVSVSWAGNKRELPSAVENIVDLHEFFAIIFDEPDVAVQAAAIDLDRYFRGHVVLEMKVIENHLAVQVHVFSPFFPKWSW